MSDPVGSNYGPATWADFTHNWRKADGDFLQNRSILRYATTVARNAISSPQPGMVIYNAETDRLELRKADASWAGLYTIDGLIIEKVGATTDIKLRNPLTAGSNGMVFTTTQIATQIPLVTAGNQLKFESTGFTINTGTKAAKLTTDASYLLSDTIIQAPGLRSTGTLNVTGASTLTGNVTASGAVTVTGLLTANGFVSVPVTPTATTHATSKSYVDTQDNLRALKAGDTFTGSVLIHQDNAASGGHCLRVRDVSNKPYIDWMDWAGNQLGWIQGTTANLTVWAKGDILLNSGGGQVRTSDAIYTVGQGRHFVTGNAVVCAGASSNTYLSWYSDASSVDVLGTRSGYIGYPGNNYLYINNEVASSSIFYMTDYAHTFHVGDPTRVEVARIVTSGMAIGKTTTGVEIEGTFLWANGSIYNTTTTGNAANGYFNRINGASGDRWMYFGRNQSWIGSISQNGTTGTLYNQTSDYRRKTIVGPITDAVERLTKMQPWRATFNDDPGRGEVDVFIAHEVQEVMPDVVTGEKDAVDDEGAPIMQEMDYGATTPLIAAAVLELAERVARLEAA